MIEVATTRVETIKVDLRKGTRTIQYDDVAVDAPVEIQLNDRHLVTLFASPGDERELMIGYLLDEGIVEALSHITEMEVTDERVCVRTDPNVRIHLDGNSYPRIVPATCSSSGNLDALLETIREPANELKYRVEGRALLAMVEELNRMGTVHALTGALHSAALFDSNGLLTCAEDVGRHNAVDKAIGKGAIKGVEFSRTVLVTSGRQPADVVLKASRMNIPISVSMRGPISSGIIAAKKTGMTLIGFARGQRMNIYTFPEKVILDGSD